MLLRIETPSVTRYVSPFHPISKGGLRGGRIELRIQDKQIIEGAFSCAAAVD